MTFLWTVADMARVMAAQVVGAAPEGVTGISIDSRTIEPGEAYFAIKGDTHDGHAFVAPALKAGAGVAVVAVSKVPTLGVSQGCLLIVPDVLEALTALGRAARRRTRARILAVTGSVGKTGTKEALRLALSQCGETHASVRSFNNHWGVPLTLARMPESAEYGIFEIGMNHPGEITPLVQMVRPHVAVVTTIAPVHIGFFKSLEAIAEAKAEIFSGLTANGVAVIPADSEFRDLLVDRARVSGALNALTFGTRADAHIRLVDVEPDAGGNRITADVMGRTVTYRLTVPGRHWIANSLAVVAAIHALDADFGRALPALEAVSAPKGRGETTRFPVPGGTVTLIDESYNANPASMRAALAVMGETAPGEGGRRIAVLGDMLELGEASRNLHLQLGDAVLDARTDLLFACGPDMQALFDVLPEFMRGTSALKSENIIEPLLSRLHAGDVVMVKGSLGTRMGPVVEAIKARLGRKDGGPASGGA